MTAAPAAIAAHSGHIAGHRCDAQAARCYVLPTASGARLFRKQGWRGFEAAVEPWARALGIDVCSVRVVSRLPSADLGASQPTTRPEILGIDRDPAGACTLSVAVPFDLAVFRGHFSTVPIVPGAMLIGWVAALGAQYLDWPHGVVAAPAIKFRRIVQPGPVYRIRLAWAPGDARLVFQVAAAAVVHATGSLSVPGP